MAAAGENGAAIKDANVVQPEKSAFKDVFSKTVFAIYPPGEVEHQLMEYPLEKLNIAGSVPCPLPLIEVERGPGMNGRIYVTEVPLIGRHLTAGMKIEGVYHQFQ